MAQRPNRELAETMKAGAQVVVVRPMPEEVGRDRAACDRDEDEENDEAAADDRDLVAAEAAPDLLPVAAGANRFDLAELTVRFDRDRRRESTGLRNIVDARFAPLQRIRRDSRPLG
jgi:hypothetical protein